MGFALLGHEILRAIRTYHIERQALIFDFIARCQVVVSDALCVSDVEHSMHPLCALLDAHIRRRIAQEAAVCGQRVLALGFRWCRRTVWASVWVSVGPPAYSHHV